MFKNSKIHYGWIIVLSGFMVTTFYMCIIMNCVGLFMIPVSEEFGISRSQFSLNTSVVSIAMMSIALSAGKIFTKFKIKKVMSISAIILPIAYGLYSVANNIYQFYAISFVVGICLSLCGLIPISTLIARWFNEKRGLATGITFTGSGLGGLFLQPLIGNLITNVGYKTTYLILAILMFVCVVPFILIFIKEDPKEMNTTPYGQKEEVKEDLNQTGLTYKEAIRTPQLYIFLVVTAISTAICSSIIQHTVPYLTEVGFTMTEAANFGAISLGALAVGKIILGQIYDSQGVLKGSVLALSLIGVTIVCYMFAENEIILYLGVLASGIGIAFSTVGYSITTLTLFGKREYGAIYGLVSFASSVGSASGAPAASFIFDTTNSYDLTWTIWTVLIIFSIVAYIVMIKTSNKVSKTTA